MSGQSCNEKKNYQYRDKNSVHSYDLPVSIFCIGRKRSFSEWREKQFSELSLKRGSYSNHKMFNFQPYQEYLPPRIVFYRPVVLHPWDLTEIIVKDNIVIFTNVSETWKGSDYGISSKQLRIQEKYVIDQHVSFFQNDLSGITMAETFINNSSSKTQNHQRVRKQMPSNSLGSLEAKEYNSLIASSTLILCWQQ